MPESGARRDTLSPRLALAFLVVALAAVALLAGLVAAFTASDVSQLAGQQRQDLARAVAVAAAAARTPAGWPGADLAPVLDLAGQAGADAQIRDQSGRTVAVSPGFGAHRSTPQATSPILARGQRVGAVSVRFTSAGLSAADNALRAGLWRAIAGAAGAAALLALATGLAVSRRITRPVGHLITATRAMAGGDRAARVGPVPAPGELGELAAAFDQMADSLGRQEQLRRDLVADVAHELRTPIAVLQAGHEALLDGITEPTPAELGSLRDEVLRLATMVGDLQTLAAADAAALQLSLVPQDLAAVTGQAADSLAGRFHSAGIALDRELAPVPIRADPRWLHQVVTNLLTNALKFTPPGGTVTIESSRAGGRAVLRVTDTGVGIPADELPRIFDRFWRGRQAARVSGSGIGLAVAAELARAHGGHLSATSDPGRGTQLTLTLPPA